MAIKRGNETNKKKQQRRNKTLKKQIEISCGSSEAAFNRQIEMLIETNRDQ